MKYLIFLFTLSGCYVTPSDSMVQEKPKQKEDWSEFSRGSKRVNIVKHGVNFYVE